MAGVRCQVSAMLLAALTASQIETETFDPNGDIDCGVSYKQFSLLFLTPAFSDT